MNVCMLLTRQRCEICLCLWKNNLPLLVAGPGLAVKGMQALRALLAEAFFLLPSLEQARLVKPSSLRLE